MKTILYSTHCPKCNVLEMKMKSENIDYETIDDIDTIQEKGFMSMPVLEVDGTAMDFSTALRWINNGGTN